MAKLIIRDRGQAALLRKLHDAEYTVKSDLQHAFVAGDAAVRAFRETKVTEIEYAKIAEDVLARAKARCPVDTGALRDSLTLESDDA
jgi:hypothetical protein